MEIQNPIVVAYWNGDWALALSLSKPTDSRSAPPNAMSWRARIHCALGDIDEALQYSELAHAQQRTAVSDMARAEAAVAHGKLTLAFSIIDDGWKTYATESVATCIALLNVYSFIETARGNGEAGYAKAIRALAENESTSPFLRSESQMALAHAALAIGKREDAESAANEALSFRHAPNSNSPWAAETLDTLGRIQRHLQDPFEAVKNHMRALEIWQSKPTLYRGPRAATYHALAQATYRCGDFHLARNQMAQSVLLTKEKFGADHVDTWISRFELARYDIDCGDMSNGFAAMEEARAAVIQKLGPDHPVVQSMNQFL